MIEQFYRDTETEQIIEQVSQKENTTGKTEHIYIELVGIM